MMAARALYLPRGLEARAYPIPTFTVPIGMWSECSGWIGKPVTIKWDEAKTTVTGARLVITRVHSDRDPVDLRVNFNGAEVRHFFWGEGTKCTAQSDVVDVTLVNGINQLEARACKHYYWLGTVSTSVSAYVEVTFEGEPPERPWWEPIGEWLEANWHWVVLGLVGAAAGSVVISYAAARALPAKI